MKDGSLRAGDINAFLDVSAHTVASVPLASTAAACGFPSPADDYMDRPLDFNELLVKNPAATFAVRISGESMRDKGLYPATSPWSTGRVRPSAAASCSASSAASSRSRPTG